jgi:hypothetical protein
MILLGLAAQATAPAAQPTAAQPAPSRRWTRTFISPMGEPFRPATRGDDALAAWFAKADGNADGRLTLVEMQQDADRFFATLDTNQDGEIDPDEISHYETVVAPEVTSGSSYGLDGDGTRRSRFGNGDLQHQGAGRFGLIDLPEPVVSADANFNRGVSRAEFRQAASQRFLALDLDHRGYLSLALLEVIRPASPARGKVPEAPRQLDDSALPDEAAPR